MNILGGDASNRAEYRRAANASTFRSWRAVDCRSAKTVGIAKLAPHDLRRYAESRIMPSSTAVRAWLKEEPVNGSA